MSFEERIAEAIFRKNRKRESQKKRSEKIKEESKVWKDLRDDGEISLSDAEIEETVKLAEYAEPIIPLFVWIFLLWLVLGVIIGFAASAIVVACFLLLERFGFFGLLQTIRKKNDAGVPPV